MSSKNIKFEYYFGDVNLVEIPDNAAVKDGVVTLTGGNDHQGRPLIVFPIEMNLKIQMSQVTNDDLLHALIYFWNVVRIPDKAAGFAFLLDFRAGSIKIIDAIISSVNAFRAQYDRSVGSVYIIRPQEQELSNRLKIQLGLKKITFISRLFNRTEPPKCFAQFQSVLLKTSLELGKYIDHNLLTNEFGGSLHYDHATWLILKEDIDVYLGFLLRKKKSFPDAEEKLILLKEYRSTEIVVDEAIAWLRRRFEETVSESGLEELFLKTDQILGELSPTTTASGSSKYSALKGNPHLDNYRMFISAVRAKLVELQSHFQRILSEAEKSVNLSEEFKEVKKFGGEAVKWIEGFGIPSIEVSPRIGSNLYEAESIARDFHNEMFIPGMKSISKCKDICQNIEKSAIVNESGEAIMDKSQYVQKLLGTVTTFNDNLQERRKLYSDVYQFHLILTRVVSWMKRTIKFMPLKLLQYHEYMNDSEPCPQGTVWKTQMHQYVLKHPSPKLHQIELIERLTNMMKDINVRNEARLLSYRIGILLKLLHSNDVTVADVREVTEWKLRLQIDNEKKSRVDIFENEEARDQSRTSLFSRIWTQNFEIEENEKEDAKEKSGESKSSRYHKIAKTYNYPKIRTSPYHNKNTTKRFNSPENLSRSQPKLNVYFENEDEDRRRKELILLAEKAVRDSLEDTHLISEKELRVGTKMGDEEELSLILNQLLYDINSNNDSKSRQSSRNPSSLQDFDDFRDFKKNQSANSLPRRRDVDYY